MYRKILIMGLPGAGKTTLAAGLAPRLNAVHFNADEVRKNVNKDLGFSEGDRIEHAHRMGCLPFVMPTCVPGGVPARVSQAVRCDRSRERHVQWPPA